MWVTTAIESRKDVPFDEIRRHAAEQYSNAPSEIRIVDVSNGYGIHVHDEDCETKRYPGCMKNHDNSDWIVTISYVCKPETHTHHNCASPDGLHQATYGVLNGQVELWMD